MSDPPQPVLKTWVRQAPQLIIGNKVNIQQTHTYPVLGIHLRWARSCWNDQSVGKNHEHCGGFNYPPHLDVIFDIK